MSDWHGYGLPSGRAVHVGTIPGRRSTALYVVDGGVVRVLAYFRTEEAAAETLALLDEFAGLPLVNGPGRNSG